MGKLLSRIMLSSSSCKISFAKLFILLYDTQHNKVAGIGCGKGGRMFENMREKVESHSKTSKKSANRQQRQ